MTQPNIIGRAFVQGCFTACFVVFLFFLAPALIQRFYPQAGAPVAAAFIGLINTFCRGLGAFHFIVLLGLLGSLIIDGYKGLDGLCRGSASSTLTPGPIALEDGTAAPTEPVDANTDTSAPVNMIPPKIYFSIAFALSFAFLCFTGDVVSLKRPLLENLSAALMFVLRGSRVLLVAFVVLVYVFRLKYNPMAQWFVSREAVLNGVITYVLLLSSSLFIPVIINRFYCDASPAAAFLVWVGDGAASGFVVLNLFISLDMLRLLIKDAHTGLIRLCRARRTPGPIALQDGAAEPVVLAPPAGVDPTMVDVLAQPTAIGKLFCTIGYGYFSIQHCFTREIMSLKRPLLANVSSTLLYIVHGSEVLGAVLIALLVMRLKQGSPTAATAIQTPTTPIVFDKEVAADVADMKEEEEVGKL